VVRSVRCVEERGKICISDYRTLIKEFEINGATKPTTMTEA
ncbi:YppF family protein, partial [Bacillus sp. 'calajunan']